MSEGSEMTPASPATQTHDELIQAAVTDAENLETMVKKGGVSQEIIDAVVKTADAVRKASQKKVVVSIAVKTKSLDGRQRRINIRMNTIACAICVAAGLLVLNDWLIRNDHICFHTPIPDKVAFVPIGLVILFLLFLLVTVVLRGSREEKHLKFPYIPDRGPAALLLALFYIALVLSFAHVNLVYGLTTGVGESVYQALMTVAALDHEHYELGNDLWKKALVGGELMSVVLLIVVFFPLLVARLALFEGEIVSLEDLKNHWRQDKPPWPQPTFEIILDSEVQLKAKVGKNEISCAAKKVIVDVDEEGLAKMPRIEPKLPEL